MNTQLENAIQEAMAQLDKMSEKSTEDVECKDSVESRVVTEKHVVVQKLSQKNRGHSNAAKRQLQNSTQDIPTSKPQADTSPDVSLPSSNLRSFSSSPAHSTRLRRSNR